MLTILDGRKNFFQWDTDQKLIVFDELVKEIHFSNAVTNPALVCEVFEENGNRVVNVPNILLQQDWNIKAYGCCDLCVRQYAEFEVIRRNKPADYVYTETEIKRYEDLEARIEELEKNGGGTGGGGGAVASVNGKVGEVVLNADDVGAVPTSRTVNGMSLSSNISISTSTIGAVPLTRKINNKALSADISLTASDVGAVKKTGDTMTGTLTGTNINLGSSTSTAINKLTITKKISDTQYINGSVGSNGSNLRVSNTLFTRSGSGSGYTSNTNNIDIGANNTTFSKPILLTTADAKEDTRENLDVYSKAEVDALIPEVNEAVKKTGDTMTGSLRMGDGSKWVPLYLNYRVNDIPYEGELALDENRVTLTKRTNGTAQNKLYLNDSNTTLMKPLTISSGGTEATTAQGARTNLDVYSKQETDAAIGEATKEGKYELIETINISEDTASIERTTEPNGTPYNYKSILLKIYFRNDAHSYNKYTLMEAIFGETSLVVFRSNEGTPTGEQVIRTYREYGYVRGEISGVTTNASHLSGGFSVYSSHAHLLTENNITQIILTEEEGFMVNDVIQIWGVRA